MTDGNAPLAQKLGAEQNGAARSEGDSDEEPVSDTREAFDKTEVLPPIPFSQIKTRFEEQRRKGLEELKKKLSQGEASQNYVDPNALKEGDYVVHKKYGIGQYVGKKRLLNKRTGEKAEYVFLRYADNMAKLKSKQCSKLLYRYFSTVDTVEKPKLSALGEVDKWLQRKKRASDNVKRMVFNVMDHYVERLQTRRPQYDFTDEMRQEHDEFMSQFPYPLTPDQQQCVDDVYGDLIGSDIPMERLVCGDVGFGKTEVALRSIWLVVMNGHQAMLMAPTTILAKQHYLTLKARFEPFGFRVGFLSRFVTGHARQDVYAGIANGTIHIVVGTHALLSPQVSYDHAALLVVDEEQRFGVKQKQKIATLKADLDVLTMSATPIPRTLHMAMNGFRNCSRITTAPPGRLPITTYLGTFDEDLLREAVQRELDRNGQMFYVVPRVDKIDDHKHWLQSLFPDVCIGVGHGNLKPSQLEKVMEDMSDGVYDILVCTTIVENGLDIPRVNTIIVRDVHMFGLSQLYQLRGRVGRAGAPAYALMFYSGAESALSEDARKRIEALRSCCGVGQGFELAEHDMAIRGVGTMFGEKQSGDVDKIGADLFMEMLYEELGKIGSHMLPMVEARNVVVNMGIATTFPPTFGRSDEEREALETKFDECLDAGYRATKRLLNELIKMYGEVPLEVIGMAKKLSVQCVAAQLGIHRIEARKNFIMLHTRMDDMGFEMVKSGVKDFRTREKLKFSDGVITFTVRRDVW